MNYVIGEVNKTGGKKMVAPMLCGDNFDRKRSAFIGTAGFGDFGLYLVTYQGITKAGNANETYNGRGCDITIDRFVDVNISIVERNDDE